MKQTKKLMIPFECELRHCLKVVLEIESETGLGQGSEVECQDGSIYAYQREDVQKMLRGTITMKEYMEKNCTKKGVEINMPRYEKDVPAEPYMKEGEWYWEFNEEFSIIELRTFGRYVYSQHLRDLHVHSVKWIGKAKNGRITKKYSTEDYPIFMRECLSGERRFYKKYEPLCPDKAFRFTYFGRRIPGYINGLEELREEYKTSPDARLKNVVICEWLPDAVRAKALGLQPMWTNSQTQEITQEQWKEIFQYCENAPEITGFEISFLEWAVDYFVRRDRLERYVQLDECLVDCRRYVKQYIGRHPFLRLLRRFAQWRGMTLNPPDLCISGTNRILKPLGFDKRLPQPGPPVDYIYLRTKGTVDTNLSQSANLLQKNAKTEK